LSPTLVAGMDRGVPFGGELLVNDHDHKVYDFLTAPERLGRLFVMPGKVAPDRIAALRTAFDAMVADAAFLAEAQRSGLTVTPMTGSAVDRAIAELYATPAATLARARSIAGE
jgi:hypothetical protein